MNLFCQHYIGQLFPRSLSFYGNRVFQKKFLKVSFISALLVGLASVSVSGNLEKGIEAAESGDFKKAYELWLDEAEKGDASAQTNVGALYAAGQGVPRDDREAAKWFHLAAAQGDTKAQTNLGALYAVGQGVPRDEQEAAKWFHMAAAQGNAKAQSYLGVLYSRGSGVKQDDQEAAKWFHMAAVQGDTQAQFSLGVMYDVGRGVAKNLVVACAWYTLAAGNGDKAAQNFKDAIQQKMTTNEIEMSQQIAEQIRTQPKKMIEQQ